MNEFLSVDRTTIRAALANLSPPGVGSGWLGVFDPSEMPKPPAPTGDPANPRCWLGYSVFDWTPQGTFSMDPNRGPIRSFNLHLQAWCEPTAGLDARDAILAAAIDALKTYSDNTATAHIFQTQTARPVSIDGVVDGFSIGVTIVPCWGGVEP